MPENDPQFEFEPDELRRFILAGVRLMADVHNLHPRARALGKAASKLAVEAFAALDAFVEVEISP